MKGTPGCQTGPMWSRPPGQMREASQDSWACLSLGPPETHTPRPEQDRSFESPVSLVQPLSIGGILSFLDQLPTNLRSLVEERGSSRGTSFLLLGEHRPDLASLLSVSPLRPYGQSLCLSKDGTETRV